MGEFMAKCLPRSLLTKLLAGLISLPIIFGVAYWVNVEKAGKSDEAGPVTATVTPPEETAKEEPTITLIAGGDIMLGRYVEDRLKKYGADWPFINISKVVGDADLALANLESPFLINGQQTPTDSLILRGYPDGVTGLKNAGFDVVSLANNHITDMGLTGLENTLDLLDKTGINHVGAGKSDEAAHQAVIKDVKGIRIGILSYTYGTNFDRMGVFYAKADPTVAGQEVATLKSQVDLVIVMVHFGSEYQATQSARQTEFANACLAAGAQIIIGGHPHVPQPIVAGNNSLVFYSLGNLVFDQQPGNNRDQSALAKITLTGSKITKLELLPYKIEKLGQPNFYTNDSNKSKVYSLFGLSQGSLNF
jgi:poly-gamma-glutamate synthesis protein (capsule biosynthesis protein)